MHPHIPAYLQKHIAEFGAEGAKWLTNLPQHVARLEQAWDFRVGAAFDHSGAVSWVAPVELHNGAEAVLKIGLPSHESRFEGDALRFLDGDGAVRLLRCSDDGFSLLLERCLPGTDLWQLGYDEGNAVACQLLARTWREPAHGAPFVSVSDFVAHWWEDTTNLKERAGYEEKLIAEAARRGRELTESQPQHVLLHGDFHPGNVLAAQREPWLIIDPKPLIGEPAYDIAQWLYNRARFLIESDIAVETLRELIDQFASKLNLDAARIAEWAFVKSVGWKIGPEFSALFHEVAKDNAPSPLLTY